jgi:hypothetical protein
MALGVKITASSRQQYSFNTTGPTAEEMLSVCPTNVACTQNRVLDCPDAKKKKKKSVNTLLKFHKLKSGRKGGGTNGVRFGAEYCAEAAGGPVLYQIRTSHSSNELLQWRHVKDRRGETRSIPENGREQVLTDETSSEIYSLNVSICMERQQEN